MFFLKEFFTLPNGSFQTGVDTETAGNGTVYQDGSYGHINTYADADASILVSADSLTVKEFAGKSTKFSIKYRLDSLNTGDYLYFFLTDKATQPEADDTGGWLFVLRLYNNAGTYQERWEYYDTTDTVQRWNGAGSTWQTASTYVRTISLDTWYELEIMFNPDDWTIDITNGTDSATTGEIRRPDSSIWWLVGEWLTTNRFGMLSLDYLKIEDIGYRNRWNGVNALTTLERIVNDFIGSILSVQNDLTRRLRQSLIAKNDILDYVPLRDKWVSVNRLGEMSPIRKSSPSQILLDGEDITSSVEKWELNLDEDLPFRKIKIVVRDNRLLKEKSPRRQMDDDYYDPRIEVIVGGKSLGCFFWDKVHETVSSRDYQGIIDGRSETALLDRPFSETITITFDYDTTKKGLVTSLVQEVPLEWKIINSTIFADTYSVRVKSPMEIIGEIVKSGGGMLLCDNEDNLICDYKDYDTDGKTPDLVISENEITKSDYRCEMPTGENSVEVMGYDAPVALGRWPIIELTASKYSLKSNGSDSLTLTARCSNEDGSLSDVREITEEEATPDTPGTIRVDNRIKRVIGVWEDSSGSKGDLVDGPYEIDGKIIRTKGTMENVQHLVSYIGGDECTFSVDQMASIEEPSVLIEAGIARTEVRASSGGGGYITATASFKGQSDSVVITMDDPRVTSIDAAANPTPIARGKTSTITVRVTGPDGSPAPDGIPVYFEIVEGRGSLTSDIAMTQTTQIDGEEVTSSTEIDLQVRFPVSGLVSIYEVINGEAYTSINYANGAAFSGSSITLANALPNRETLLKVTYTSGGTAITTYEAPKIVSGEAREDRGAFVAYIRCRSGGEDALVAVEVGALLYNINWSQSSAEDLPWQWEYFPREYKEGKKGVFLATGAKEVHRENRFISSRDGYTIDFDNRHGVTEHKNCTTSLEDVRGGDKYIVCEVKGEKQQVSRDWMDHDGDIHGMRWVKEDVSEIPIEGAMVKIDWDDDGSYDGANDEGETTREDGSFSFEKGRPGKHRIQITHDDYELLEDEIEIPGSLDAGYSEPHYEYRPVEYCAKVRWRYKRI